MTSYAAAFMLNEGLHRLGKPAQKHATVRTFSVPLIEFVRPDGYWPQPFTIEQAFEVFRWMVTGAALHSEPSYWGRMAAIDLLSATSGEGHDHVIPVRGIQDLRSRFHYGILGRLSAKSQLAWRKALGIDVAATVQIRARVHKPFAGAPHLGFRSEGHIRETIERITTGSVGATMAWSLNSSHRGCRTLHHVRIAVGAEGFAFHLSYGDPLDTSYSQWTERIAATRDRETFLETLARARDAFDMLVHGTGTSDLADMSDFTRRSAIPCPHARRIAA